MSTPYVGVETLVDDNSIILVIAIAKCLRAKQKLEDDRTEFCKY